MTLLWGLLMLVSASFLFIVLRGAPYVPTHQKDVDALFDLYRFKPRDLLVDLGSGDGRVLEAAARRGVRAVGYELNPFLALLSRYRLRRTAVKQRIVIGDFWVQELPQETAVVFVFLAKPFMEKLDKKMNREAKRLGHPLVLVSYAMKISGREPERVHGALIMYRYTA